MYRRYLLPGVAAVLIFGIAAFAYVHRAAIAVLNPQGPIAFQERWVIGITVALAAIVVIPVFVLLFFFAWKYRADRSDGSEAHEPDWDHDHWSAEAVWWLVPTVIIIILSIIMWQTAHQLDPFKPIPSQNAPITVQVVALDWKWLFIYPDQGIATVNMVEFPVNTPVHFEITADAPMNQFWIPSLGGQIMAMPGMQTELNLMASNVGNFYGLSSEISGTGFAGMTFTAKSVSVSDFATWVQSVQAQSNPLTPATYTALAAPSSYVPVTYFSPIDDSVYTTSIMKYMMPMQVAPPATSSAPAMSGMDMSDMSGMQMSTSTP